MAFTQQEKEKICRFSGWPLQALIPNTTFFNNYFTQWITNVEYSQTGEDTIRTFLTRIDAIDQALQDAIKRLAVSSIGHNELSMNQREMTDLRAERRRVIREMKDTLNIPGYYE